VRPLGRRCGPSTGQIIRAVPPGSRRLRGRRIERKFTDALAADPRLAALRADARENILAYARWLAHCAVWATGISFPGRDALCEQTGLSASTVKACRRRLEAWGYQRTVSEGCKRWHGEQTRSDRAVYVLCRPAQKTFWPAVPSPSGLTRPPTVSPDCSQIGIPMRPARDGEQRDGPRSARAAPRGRPRDPAADAGEGAAGAVAGVLRTAAGHTISDKGVAWLLRRCVPPAWLAGRDPAGDVRHAIDHDPDGAPYTFDTRVRRPLGRIRWRLAQWRDEHGSPLPSKSQRLDELAAREAAGQKQRRTADEAGRAAAADPAPHAASIWQAQRWHGTDPGKPLITWTRGTRHCTGTLWSPGPEPGTVWAVPVDAADGLWVLVLDGPAGRWAADGEDQADEQLLEAEQPEQAEHLRRGVSAPAAIEGEVALWGD